MKATPEPHHHDHPARQPDPDGGDRSFWTVLPGTADSPRRARTAIRHMLTVWDLASLIPGTELMATELIAKAAESAPGYPIGFAISQHTTPAGQPGITCEISDHSAQLPDAQPAHPGTEPARAPAIVAALATGSGVATWPGGKTAWFTLTTPDPARAAEPELQAGPRPQQQPGRTPPVTGQPDPDRQRYVALTLTRRPLYGLAEDAGGHQFIARPAYRGGPMVTDLVPLSGADVSRQIELAAREHARDYIRYARETGHTWHQIGTALRLVPDSDARQAGDTAAEAAFTYAAGHPGTEHARRYGRSVAWHCGSCDRAISDHGLRNGPAADERGHAGNCTRLAATIAAWDTEWEAGQ